MSRDALAGREAAVTTPEEEKRNGNTYVGGSAGATPKSIPVRYLDSQTAPQRPLATPTAAKAIPWETISRKIADRDAPRAIRMPISRVRCAVAYATVAYTPATPTAAIKAKARPHGVSSGGYDILAEAIWLNGINPSSAAAWSSSCKTARISATSSTGSRLRGRRMRGKPSAAVSRMRSGKCGIATNA